MQNKVAIRFVAIIFALVCIYELSFTIATRRAEKKAKTYSEGDIAKEESYLDSISNIGIYNFLGLKNFTYKECKEKEINLGLDLKGGMNVTMEVDVADILMALSNNSREKIFQDAIAKAKLAQQSSEAEFVDLFITEFERIDPNAKLSSVNIFGASMKGKFEFGAENEVVLRVLKDEIESAIDNTYNVLRTRIDKFGVTQPNIQKAGITGRIVIELPGVKEPGRVRNLLQGAANLEFWEVYKSEEFFPYLKEANEELREILRLKTTDSIAIQTKESTDNAVTSIKNNSSEDTTELSLLEHLESTPTDSLSLADSLQQQSFENWKEENPLFALLFLPTNEQNQIIFGLGHVGFAQEKDISKINKYLSMSELEDIFRDVKFMWEGKPEGGIRRLYAAKNLDGKAPLDGSVMTDADQDYDQYGKPDVTMTMNTEGAKIWSRLTRENVKSFIAVALDNYVYSAPRVNEEINSKTSQITGNFTVEEAKDLATKLKSGKLPVPARIVSESVVGPSLGKESIRAGIWSFLIAFVLVLLYMVFFYSRRAGFVANLALITNLFFVFGVLASFHAVLTLPGIAGIVLTIGMSVDANVLIYERIKEELIAGKRVSEAISKGYWNAYPAILDGNITTFLTGVILFVFGEGPIKGFATTLMIGICTSLFSAIFITRLIFEWMLDRKRKITFSTPLTENWLRNINFSFLSKRKFFYMLSLVFIIASLASLFTRGLDQSIDFTGGRTYVVTFDNDVNTEVVSQSLATVYGSLPEVKTFGSNNQVKVSTKYKINEEGTDIDNEIEDLLYQGLQSFLSDGTTKNDFLKNNRRQSDKVGPTIADDIKRAAVWAIVFALIVIFLYIMIRFNNWQYGLGALAALAHDTIIVLGIFSIFYGVLPFSLEIDQAFIAAILTVVGYSINDTVVVFDRIREYLKLYPKRERDGVVNKAMATTLRRTFSTSLSTFVVLLAIFLFGGISIKGFIFGLMVGVIVGTYSSLFIATPIAYDTAIRLQQIKKRKKR